jgi:hypothetical protein
MRFSFCVVPIAETTNEPGRPMTTNFAPRITQAATQIRLRSQAVSCEAAEPGGACIRHPRDARRGWDHGTTFGRWPE